MLRIGFAIVTVATSRVCADYESSAGVRRR